ncbi:uncharacterized protein [Eurosta solidaginis]|uniref:uncharacterized protein n=1 Tax=Eurosta solidaginis TaxID=178769 RepID=UPI003530CF7E
MINKFNVAFAILLLCATISVQQITAAKEIIDMLKQSRDLVQGEINALWPLFKNLQDQYDYMVSQTGNDNHQEGSELMSPNESTKNELENEFENLFQEYLVINSSNNHNNNIINKYNTTLPSLTELMDVTGLTSPTNEELAERADIESLLEDALNETQMQIDEIVRRSLQLELQLIKINKPKLVEYIFRALQLLYRVSARLGRAAYCTYSHIPQLNESLHNIYDGVDCYKYSKHLMLQVEQETVQTVSTIRLNVFSLADIYKKIASKKTLLGKLSAVILNLMKIVHSINETFHLGITALDRVQNLLPDAVNKSVSCGRNFIDGVPQITEMVANLSYCITFVDNNVKDYDFMKPENERDFM